MPFIYNNAGGLFCYVSILHINMAV